MRSRMNLFVELTRLAVGAIASNKLRAFLTLLGIIVGVASVMLVAAGIQGGEQYLVDTVSKTLGSYSFILSKYPRFGAMSVEEFRNAVRRNPDLSLDDLEFVRRNCPTCEDLSAELSTSRSTYRGSNEVLGTQIIGSTANGVFLRGLEVEEGRFFSRNEVSRSQFVCVIGQDLVEELFDGLDPIGKSLKVSNVPLRVVGTLESQGSGFLGSSLDNVLFLPITAFQKMYGSRTTIEIRGRAADSESFQAALEQARMAMRIRHKLESDEDDDFGIISTEEINDSLGQMAGVVQAVVIPITMISLVVGAIVVMNIMLVSVTERTFEIGLRKSLGARRRDILNQFLIESVILASLGGAIGLLSASGVAWLVEAATPIPMKIGLGYAMLSLGVSGGIGIVAGLWPAFRASRLDPIQALGTDK